MKKKKTVQLSMKKITDRIKTRPEDRNQRVRHKLKDSDLSSCGRSSMKTTNGPKEKTNANEIKLSAPRNDAGKTVPVGPDIAVEAQKLLAEYQLRMAQLLANESTGLLDPKNKNSAKYKKSIWTPQQPSPEMIQKLYDEDC